MSTTQLTRSGRWQYFSGALLATDEFLSVYYVGDLLRDIVLDQLSGYSSAAATRYLQLHSAVPVLGAVPLFTLPVAAGQAFAWEPGAPGFAFPPDSAGNAWYVSTTGPTYTASADTFWVQAAGRARVQVP